MHPLLRQLLDVCLLRAGPQDLPYSPALARGMIAAQIGVNLIYAVATSLPNPVGRIALADAVLLAAAWIALAWRDRTERYAQTVTALFGCSLLFVALLLPLTLTMQALQPEAAVADPQAPIDPRRALVMLVMLVVLGWKIMVNGHIFRQALDWPHGAGILLALGVYMTQQGFDQLLFPLPEPAR